MQKKTCRSWQCSFPKLKLWPWLAVLCFSTPVWDQGRSLPLLVIVHAFVPAGPAAPRWRQPRTSRLSQTHPGTPCRVPGVFGADGSSILSRPSPCTKTTWPQCVDLRASGQDAIAVADDSSIIGSGEDAVEEDQERVPVTIPEALRVFFLGQYHGPVVVLAAILSLSACRWNLPEPMQVSDAVASGSMIVLWWFQEHFLHGRLLHSDFEWYGKQVHADHHARPYYHVSIDPAPLMVGWLFAVQGLLLYLFPVHLAISAAIGYACAGLFYEWAHYIVHTRVRFPARSYWKRLKDHHIRHHLVDN